MVVDGCYAQLQIPKMDILLSLDIKEIDHIVFIKKCYVHVMFHETASRKLLFFTLYVYPYMSNGVSHFNLLDELITTFVFFFFFFIQIFSEQQWRI